jgi:diaminohydroxyphosphoribosylaminopyrimidine deaminase/5-amino-6-(5-phosphoribosylamino)uracil reductase
MERSDIKGKNQHLLVLYIVIANVVKQSTNAEKNRLLRLLKGRAMTNDVYGFFNEIFLMHTTYLQQALTLAQIRRGFCAPNPAVGAVVVQNEVVVATGYHFASGCPHAEAEALNKLQDNDITNATLYVTLEPCCHTQKKTPPCTELIIRRGIKKVIYAFRDPNPLVAGLGEKKLREAGIECLQVALPEIDSFYASYQHWWQTKTPYVTAKLALSLDGKIAGMHGERVVITGEAAQQFTHQQRKLADAILTTAKTIHADNPLLNVRLENQTLKKPIYILDSHLSLLSRANIFSTAEKITIFHRKDIVPKNNAARFVAVEHNGEYLDLNEILRIIGQDGIHDLWVEAGGTCFTNFLQAQLLQCAFVYIAPKLLGCHAQAAFNATTNLLSTVKTVEWQSLGHDAVGKFYW